MQLVTFVLDSVPDPVCLSRILIFLSRIPGLKIKRHRIAEPDPQQKILSIFLTPKIVIKHPKVLDPDPRVKKTLDPDRQHCFSIVFC
jgi:hypothetical protein